MKIEKFAAIDIGSNAIRLLISNVIIKKGIPIKFIKSSIVRVPIRLGQESFTIGEISSKIDKKPCRCSSNRFQGLPDAPGSSQKQPEAREIDF